MCKSNPKKHLLIVISILALISLCLVGTKTPNSEYTPVLIVQDGGDFQINEVPELNTKEHKKRFCAILDKYGVKYRVKDDYLKVFILLELALNKELLANYTKKAEELKSPLLLNQQR